MEWIDHWIGQEFASDQARQHWPYGQRILPWNHEFRVQRLEVLGPG